MPNLREAEAAMAEYGYTLTPEGELVTPSGKETGVICRAKGARVQMRSSCGLLWSGTPSLAGRFLEGYWFARKLGNK